MRPNRLPSGITAAAALLLCAVTAQAGVHVEGNVAVRMRDGVPLQADVRRPARSGRFPVLVYRTPYGRRHAPAEDTIFRRAVERGYAVVLQDVRGRYGSQGEFEPYRNEGRDGYDTIEWAAAQPWSNGRVGTFGLSYPGAVQWLAAVESPPHLEAMAPAMTFSTPRNFFYAGGVFDLSWPAWIWNNIAPDVRVRKGLPGPRTVDEAEKAWARVGDGFARRLPLSALTELRDIAPWYFDWLRYPPADSWWDWAEIRGRYGRVTAAVLNLSGWHDEAYGPEGAITNFQGLVASRAGADPRTELVLGPWVHGSDAVGRSRVGDREMGRAAALDYEALVLDFMDRHLRGRAKAPARVRVFVMGENAWQEADSFPLPGTRGLALHLAAGGGLAVQPPAAASATTPLPSDPARPVWDAFASVAGAHDYRALAARPDVAVFETEPLDHDLRVVGPIEAEIFVSVDAPDTDLWLKLQDVAEDGTAYNLSSPGTDVVRASGTEGGVGRWLRPGEVVALRFPNLRTGNLFRRGHRIRIVLTTSFQPYFSRNLHTGKSEVESSESRPALVRVFHDAERPSRVVLPVVGPEPLDTTSTSVENQ